MNKITKLLGIKYPIIQGAMANISDAEFAAQCSNSGILGVIATSTNDGEWLKNEIRKIKTLTNKSFAVNVLLLSPYIDEIAQIVIDEKVKIVTTGAGSPKKYIKKWQEAGIIVIPVVPSVGIAKKMEQLGADAVIAEGMEAGGHIGKMTTFTLVPQVVDAVSIPVIAAGGIADKRGLLAAFALGASGIQMGTRFLATNECPIHENYKKLIINSRDNDTIITSFNNSNVRSLKNKLTIEISKSNNVVSIEEKEKMLTGSLKKAIIDGDIENGSFMAGQISGLITEVLNIEDIVKAMFKNIKNDLNDLEKTLDL